MGVGYPISIVYSTPYFWRLPAYILVENLNFENMNKKDALGNEVVIGKRYGYAISSSGITTAVIGKAVRFTSTTGCTLMVESAMRAVYSDPAEPCTYERKTVTVKCLCLFPIV